MDYTELLFAAKVYERAAKIRGESIPDEVHTDDFPAWKRMHPVSDYVEQAFEEIHSAALQIRKLTGRQ